MAYLLASVRIFTWLMIAPPFSPADGPHPAEGRAGGRAGHAVAPITGGAEIPGTTWACSWRCRPGLVGALMGFVTMLLFSAVAAAGSLIDLFGLLRHLGGVRPLNMTMNTIMGKFHAMLAMALLIVSAATCSSSAACSRPSPCCRSGSPSPCRPARRC